MHLPELPSTTNVLPCGQDGSRQRPYNCLTRDKTLEEKCILVLNRKTNEVRIKMKNYYHSRRFVKHLVSV